MEERAINLKALADENLAETMRRDFNYSTKISKRSCLLISCSKYCSSKSKRYAQLLKRSETRMDAEMDLQKFLYRQRVAMTALIGLLNRRQAIFVDKFSQLVLRESSDAGRTSSDDELEGHRNEDIQFARRMQMSRDRGDKRLLKLYKLSKATQKIEGSGVAVLDAADKIIANEDYMKLLAIQQFSEDEEAKKPQKDGY